MVADIRKLAISTWRDIAVPTKELTHRFAHESSPAHVAYAQGDFFDMTGSRARTWECTIPFNESLNGWEKLFSKSYPKFYEAMRDRSPGTLVTPLQGPILCVPGSYEEQLTPMVLDGPSVRCTWSEHTPIEGSYLDAPPNLQAIFSEATALDNRVAGKSWDGGSPLPTADPLTAVAATINQLNTARDKVKANILSVSDRANAVETACERLGSNGGPKTNAIRLAARRLRLRSERAANSPPREMVGRIVQYSVTAPISVMQAARDAGMDLKDFIELNFTLAKQVLIPPGTNIFVKAK